jgi:hypothetical protein
VGDGCFGTQFIPDAAIKREVLSDAEMRGRCMPLLTPPTVTQKLVRDE